MEKTFGEFNFGGKDAIQKSPLLTNPRSESEIPRFHLAQEAPDRISQKRPSLSVELKERYRREADFLRKKLGPLEDIRRELGLSQRKISELLLVDPASWHRWAKQGSAPGYIYKSLQWFLALRDRNPEIASLVWLKTQSSTREGLQLEGRLEELSLEVAQLKLSAANPKPSILDRLSASWAFIALGVAVGFSLCYWLLRGF